MMPTAAEIARTEGQSGRQGTSRWPWWIVAVCLLALGLRLYHLDSHGLWLDEFYSQLIASGQLKGVPLVGGTTSFLSWDLRQHNTVAGVVVASIETDGGNGILYQLLLHGWLSLAGNSDFAVRLPSVLCGVAIVMLVYRLATVSAGRTAAVVAAVFAAFHPLLVRYSQETRTYAMGTCLVLVASLLFLRILAGSESDRPPVWTGVAYGLCVWACLLAHILTIDIFLAHLGVALWQCRSRRAWIGLALGAAVCISGMAWCLAHGGSEGLVIVGQKNRAYQERLRHPRPHESFVLPATPANVGAGLVQIACAMSGNNLQAGGIKLRSLVVWLLLPIGLTIAAVWRRTRPLTAGLGLVLAIVAVHPLISALTALQTGHILPFQPLYSNFATPAMVILMAAGAARLRRRPVMATLVAAATIGVVGWSLGLVYADAPMYRAANPYPSLAWQLTSFVPPDAVAEFPSWEDVQVLDLYLPPDTAMRQRVRHDPQSQVVRIMQGSRELTTLPLPPRL